MSNSTEMEQLADSVFQAVQKYVDDRLDRQRDLYVALSTMLAALPPRLEEIERRLSALETRR